MEKIPMTQRGFDLLQEELSHLKNVERPQIIKAISDAREHGDLSENAEYHAAKERQGFNEGRIAELEDRISRAEIINVKAIQSSSVKFGATVTVIDDETGDKTNYQIVGSDESDVKKGLLSITSPLARALINKQVNDVIEVTTPSGCKMYTIETIDYV
ncbi:MAG: transcription elongation factor GreA [Proteobacteria bacterium]|nr:transcription elongation factor GreA [Pseudomonadota bacterium]